MSKQHSPRPIPPPGFIVLSSVRTGRWLHVSLERICAYGEGYEVSEHRWLALSGRSSLLFVLETMEEIALRIKVETNLR